MGSCGAGPERMSLLSIWLRAIDRDVEDQER